MSIVGLFGLSGVGKSFFSEKLIQEESNFTCVKASDLIKFASGEILYENLNKQNVDRNQQILSREFASFRANHPNKSILIELHNVIETPLNIEFLRGEVFETLMLTHVVFLQLAPKKLYQQRLNDASKVRRLSGIDELKSLQDWSKNLCLKTFASRKIPLLVLESDDRSNLKKLSDFVQ